MRAAGPAPVVVGVNGSAAGLAAVRLAARESVARHRDLRVVHAFAWPTYDSVEGRPYDELHRRAAEVLARAVQAASRSAPAARVSGYLVDGLPTRVLLEQSRGAELLVLGDDDLAGTTRLPTDSVLVQCVARSRCPVLVARAVGPPSGPVVVGIDGSPPSLLALRYAEAEAARRHTGVHLLHVAEGPDAPAAGCSARQQPGRRVLDEAVGVAGRGLAEARLLSGDPAEALIRSSTHAQLLVLAPRGTGARLGTLLGSVALSVLRRCACPTLFVHGSPDAPPRTG